ETLELARTISAAPGLELEAVWTHFAEADDPASIRTAEQLRRFLHEVAQLDQAGIHPAMLHSANSAAALLHPETRLDLVRCGLPVYGYPSAPGEEDLGLRPALTWKVRVVAIHQL